MGERIATAAADFASLLSACGPRARRDLVDEDLASMQQLLGGVQPAEPEQQV